ncbi:uncharacterized protein LOC17898602 [Capsella rubella]|nr:uncharacterized protein LOC17898602 [Capsella rubella]
MVKDVIDDEYIPNRLRDLKIEQMAKALKKITEENNNTAAIVKTSWSNEDGEAKSYQYIEVTHGETHERFVCDIDFSDELSETIGLTSYLAEDVPQTFVGTEEDLRRVVAAISEEEDDEELTGRLVKWLGPRA